MLDYRGWLDETLGASLVDDLTSAVKFPDLHKPGRIFLIHGPPASGKSTVLSYLEAMRGHIIEIPGISSDLREELSMYVERYGSRVFRHMDRGKPLDLQLLVKVGIPDGCVLLIDCGLNQCVPTPDGMTLINLPTVIEPEKRIPLYILEEHWVTN